MIWIKPNGNELETNDEKATIAYCKSLGWEEKGAKKAPAKKAAKQK